MKLFIILTLLVITTSAQFNTRCTTPNSKPGKCIQYTKCYELRKLATSRTPSDKQYLRASQCGFLVQPLVCCPNLKIEEVGGDDFCLQTDPLDKIAGGNQTKIDEFRWMAQLQYKINGEDRYEVLCAGSIINKRFILTAAHCFEIDKYTLQNVILGEWDTRTNPDTENGTTADPIQTYKVKSLIQHEEYNIPSQYDNDIGLVQLDNEIVYTDWIKPICVPNSADLKSRDLTDYELTVSGWGRTSGRANANVSPVKLKAVIAGTSNSYCEREYQKFGYTISDKQFCAFKPGVDACRGDSGGPVIATDQVNNNVYMYIAGIVSFGPKSCGGLTTPGVYTKVAAYISWIKQKLE